MRISTCSVALTATLLLPWTGMAWTVTPGDTTPGQRSVLAPRSAEPLPAPVPVAPETSPVPNGLPSGDPPSVTYSTTPPGAPPASNMPAPAGGEIPGVTAVPLPPPALQTPAPQTPPPARPAPAALAPAPTAPISLAPPRPGPGAIAVAPVAAQPAAPGAKGGVPAARLPTPALSPEAAPADFLRAARSALVAGRAGEARSALEMAQTRLLDRTIDAGKERTPIDDLAVKQISEAIGALAANDRTNCLRFIEFASKTIGNPLN